MRRARWLLVAMIVGWAGCHAALPEPESEGARLYASHCNSCHRVYGPKSMTYEMWKVQVERMQGELVRHGLPPLTERERTVVLDYLKRHSS